MQEMCCVFGKDRVDDPVLGVLFAQNTLKQAQVVQIDIFKQQSATIKPNIFKTWSSVSFTNELIKLLDKIEATDINSERY